MTEENPSIKETIITLNVECDTDDIPQILDNLKKSFIQINKKKGVQK